MTGTPTRRWALLGVVALSGAVLLAFEFVGQRMLAAVWGSDVAVWGATISVVMGGMAAGYAVGGRLSDRAPLRVLARALSAGAVVLCVLAAVGADGLDWLGGRLPDARPGALLGALLLLGAPSLLLSMTSPLAVGALREHSAGRRSGDVFAIGTAGSIAGALMTSFVLIGTVELTLILAGGAGLLAVAVVITLVLAGAGRAVAVTIAVALVVVSLAALAAGRAPVPRLAADQVVRFDRESPYQRVLVIDADGGRSLVFADGDYIQSRRDLQDPGSLELSYTRQTHQALCAGARPRRALVLGVGGGTLIGSLRRASPGIRIDAVELDPEILIAARRWFALPAPDARLRYHRDDARRAVVRSRGRHDLVVVDLYNHEYIPSHVATREFFAAVARRLSPGGVVAVNVIGAPDDQRASSVRRTIAAAFPRVGTVRAGGNLVVLASDRPLRRDTACLAGVERRLGLARGELTAAERVGPPSNGRILTDALPLPGTA